MVFPVVMYGCESWNKESWAQKNWCFWTVVLEKTLESPLDCKEIHPVHPKGCSLEVLGVHWKLWCWSWNPNTLATRWEELTHLKRPWCWERLKAGGEGDDRGWDGWWWAPGVGVGQRGLAWCSSWGHKESDTTEWLNWTELSANKPLCWINSTL